MKRRIPILSVLIVVLLALASCSGGGGLEGVKHTSSDTSTGPIAAPVSDDSSEPTDTPEPIPPADQPDPGEGDESTAYHTDEWTPFY